MTSHRKFLLSLLLAFAAAACHRGANDPHNAQTQTIAPAAAQPAPNTGDSEMTQTVDVEDSRSVAEGETSTAAQPAPGTTKKAPAAPAKKKR